MPNLDAQPGFWKRMIPYPLLQWQNNYIIFISLHKLSKERVMNYSGTKKNINICITLVNYSLVMSIIFCDLRWDWKYILNRASRSRVPLALLGQWHWLVIVRLYLLLLLATGHPFISKTTLPQNECSLVYFIIPALKLTWTGDTGLVSTLLTSVLLSCASVWVAGREEVWQWERAVLIMNDWTGCIFFSYKRHHAPSDSWCSYFDPFITRVSSCFRAF